MQEAKATPAASRDQVLRDRVGPAEGPSQCPDTGDGRHTQSKDIAGAWRDLGLAYGRMYDEVERAAAAFVEGFAEARIHPADRAIREWQCYLARLPWWKRWALKLWYSF